MKYLRAKRATYFGNLKTLERTHGFRIFHVSTWILVVKMFLIILLYMVATNSVEIAEYKPIGDTDFVLLIDDSASMGKTDFKPNRLESAKDIASRWLAIVPNSTQISVIGFSKNIDYQSELTTNKNLLRNTLNSIELNYTRSGTDIDYALSYAIGTIKDSSQNKTILLFTDGTQNVSDKTISRAIDEEVKIVAFGIGTTENTEELNLEDIPEELRDTYSDLSLEFEVLETIAKATGGKAYRITEELQLQESFQDATLEQVNVRINSAFYVTMFIAFMSILELIIFARVGAL